VTIIDVGEVNSEKFNGDANVITVGAGVAGIALVVLLGRYCNLVKPLDPSSSLVACV
jgi:FAD/FMN-containing dehydrogenase